MGSWIRNMSQHSTTLRPDFSNITYPSYVPMMPDKVLAMLGEENNLASAFSPLSLLMTKEYKAYVDNPTDANAAKKARDLFKAKPLKDKNGDLVLNVPRDSPSASYYTSEGAESLVPEYLEFPFLPSWEALARDSGKSFQEDSTMTAFTANAAVLVPILVYNLFKGGDSKGNILSSKDAVSNDTRKI